MRELCIPVSDLDEEQIAEVEVKIGGKRKTVHFRLESFPWHVERDRSEMQQKPAEPIQHLINLIKGYDRRWELIQLYNPAPGEEHIRVLFRERPAAGKHGKGGSGVR